MKKPIISIVVVTYNRAGMLRKALSSLMNQQIGEDVSCEIVVVDDGSTDITQEVIMEFRNGIFPVRYSLGEGKGVASARNRGIKEAAGEWIAFFDDDQLADVTWLKELFFTAIKCSAYCVGGRILLSLPEIISIQLSPVCRELLGESVYRESFKSFSGKTLPGTGNVLIKRTLIENVGHFDTSLLVGCEDTDFFRKLRRAGFEMWYAPKAIAHHVIPAYRLREEYFLWTSARQGVSYAYLEYKEKGMINLIVTSILRFGKAIFITLPYMLRAFIAGDGVEILGARCLIWRTSGYIREALLLFLPRLFSQESFFARLEFRKERSFLWNNKY